VVSIDFCVVLYLEKFKFLQMISKINFLKDFEKFYFLKEELDFFSSYKNFNVECMVCQLQDHRETECNLQHFSPVKRTVFLDLKY
jgi:hypothetical protein